MIMGACWQSHHMSIICILTSLMYESSRVLSKMIHAYATNIAPLCPYFFDRPATPASTSSSMTHHKSLPTFKLLPPPPSSSPTNMHLL